MRNLIDADSLIFKAGFSNETHWYDVHVQGQVVHSVRYKKQANELVATIQGAEIGSRSEAGDVSHSLANLKNSIQEVMDQLHGTKETYIGGDHNFRKQLYPEYKAHRTRRPVHEAQLRGYLIKHWDAVVVHGEEVDDRVSWEHCCDPGETCIVSIDKDLNNTPGEHYNYNTKERYFITPDQADLNFWRQMITGDSTDGIPGIPQHGTARAMKELPQSLPYHEMEDTVYRLYKEQRLSDDYFILQGRLLWMRRQPGEMWSSEQVKA